MAMSKKDFIALAWALRAVKPDVPENYGSNAEYLQACHTWQQCVGRVEEVCARRNPNFNRGRWLGYIAGTNGPNGGTR